jgi:glycosyltransferase involved in cell wall biosynthesis
MLPARRTVYAIDNPIEIRRESRATAETNNGVVFVGRLSAEKGGLLLAEAARIAEIDVLFIGEGPEREAIARVNPRARFTGWLDHAGVVAALRSSRCVVVPSLWYETLGLVVLEAAALGIPAIVPTGTDARDLVVPGRSGLTFARGNVDELAQQLRSCRDDLLLERLSRSAYDTFWNNPPTMSQHVAGLLSAYRDVIRQQPAQLVARAS